MRTSKPIPPSFSLVGTKPGSHDAGEETEELIPFLRGYTVFNTQQIEGLPQQYYDPSPPRCGSAERVRSADRFFAKTGATIKDGQQPCYVPSRDEIRMPPPGKLPQQRELLLDVGS